MDSNIEPGKIFVGGISWETSEENLKRYFERYGKVADVTIMNDLSTGKPRGFGFVLFQDPSSVASVLAEKEHYLDEKKIDPKVATTSNGSTGITKVFVGGIPATVTEKDVKDRFQLYGEVVSVDLKYDKDTNRMRGFGFVEFSSEEDVQLLLSRHYVELKGKSVEIKPAQPKHIQQSQKANAHVHGAQMQASPYAGGFSTGYGTTGGYSFGNQPPPGRQYTAPGAGYGYGGAYTHSGGASPYQQYAYTAAIQQPQQMSSYGQDSTSYSAPTANTYATAEGYHNTAGYGYSEPRGAPTGGYTSFGAR